MAVDNPDADPEGAQMAAIPDGTTETDGTEAERCGRSRDPGRRRSRRRVHRSRGCRRSRRRVHRSRGCREATESTEVAAVAAESADAEASSTPPAAADVAAESADAEASSTPPVRPAPAPAPDQTERASAEAGRPNRRKIREGLVLSVAMDQTAVVGVIERVRHPRYAKTVQRTKRLYAHDPNNNLRVGDRVRLAETRPMSKLKRWRVVDVLERAR